MMENERNKSGGEERVEKEAGSTNVKKGSLRSGEAGYNNPLG